MQNHFSDFLPKNFLNYFTKTTNLHDHNTKGIRLNVPIVNTTYLLWAQTPFTLKAPLENGINYKLSLT